MLCIIKARFFFGFDMTPLDSMNPAQREAITLSPDVSNIKDILIVAGAGSGKTRVVVNRIAYLMSEHRVHPGHIVGLTFTRKAAKEMSARLTSMVNAGRHVKLCTFHTLAADLIRGASSEHIEIIDDTDQNRMSCRMMSVKSGHNKLKIEAVNRQRTQEEIKILQKMIATLKKNNKKLTAG